MKVLADARQKLDIPWENPDNNKRAEFILNFDNRTTLDTRLFMAYASSVCCLWKDAAIKRAFERRREFQLSDSVQYFLDNIENIARSVSISIMNYLIGTCSLLRSPIIFSLTAIFTIGNYILIFIIHVLALETVRL